MYNFYIPDSNTTRQLNHILFGCMWEHPDWFLKDFKIAAAYGVPPFCIWNGNRIELYEDTASFSYVVWVKNIVNDLYGRNNVGYRAIFTNSLLQPHHLYDVYSNKFLKEFAKTKGDIMVGCQLMADYLKQNYPDTPICWSTTTDFGCTVEAQIRKINELSEKEIVVLPYTFNNKEEILKQLIHPENLEILVNEKCVDDCPYRKIHYTMITKSTLMELDSPCDCFTKEEVNYVHYSPKHLVNRDKLDWYVQMGINKFKLEGRGNAKGLLLSYCDFFVKPSAKKDFAMYVINRHDKSLLEDEIEDLMKIIDKSNEVKNDV